MLVDSHCHLDFPDFASELDGVVARAAEAGIGRMVTISTRVRRLNELLAIAERYDNVYCSVGTHPHHADEEDGIAPDELIALTRHPKVVELVGAEVEAVNRRLPSYETIKYHRIVAHDFSQETGELTPSLKVKRKLVNQKYQDLIEEMYR